MDGTWMDKQECKSQENKNHDEIVTDSVVQRYPLQRPFLHSLRGNLPAARVLTALRLLALRIQRMNPYLPLA
jgi:hypothetical protein